MRRTTVISLPAGGEKPGLELKMSAWSQVLIFRVKIFAKTHGCKSNALPSGTPGTLWKKEIAPSWNGIVTKLLPALFKAV
jgi:hypothetical protein